MYLITFHHDSVASFIFDFCLAGNTCKCQLSFCNKGCFTAHKSHIILVVPNNRGQHCILNFSLSLSLCLTLFLPLLKLEHMTSTPTLSHVNYQSPHPGVRSHPRKTNQSNQKALLLECGFVTPTVDPPSLQQVLKICGGQFSLVWL